MLEALESAAGIALVVLGLAALTYTLASAESPNAQFGAYLIPMISFFGWLLIWYEEQKPPATGDNQPGLVLLVGGVMTGSLLLGAAGGTLRRRHRR